jgi:hypothetical protein
MATRPCSDIDTTLRILLLALFHISVPNLPYTNLPESADVPDISFNTAKNSDTLETYGPITVHFERQIYGNSLNF